MSEVSEGQLHGADIKPAEPIRSKSSSDGVLDNIELPPVSEVGEGSRQVELLRVFGQGPVKPLVLREELPPEKQKEWDEFKQDPLHGQEPDFRVLEGKAYLKQLEGLSQDDKNRKLIEWQKLGRFGLNRYGRQNALAAAREIRVNKPKRVLVSGGRTLPPDADTYLPQDRIKQTPSEGELIADIIKRDLGKDFQPPDPNMTLDEYITVQKDSTSTLLEFANMINEHPEYLNGQLVFIGADYHVERIMRLARRFAPDAQVDAKSAQKIILDELERINQERTELDATRKDSDKVGKKTTYDKILRWMTNPNNKDYEQRLYEEIVFNKELEDPETLSYWLGFVGAVEDPKVLQETIEMLSQDKYRAKATELFASVGLDFNILSGIRLSDNPAEFDEIRKKLSTLMERRTMPEESKSFKKRLVPANSLIKT